MEELAEKINIPKQQWQQHKKKGKYGQIRSIHIQGFNDISKNS